MQSAERDGLSRQIHCGSIGGAGPAPRQNTISAGNSITAVGANQGRQSRAARFARSRRGAVPAAGGACIPAYNVSKDTPQQEKN